MNFDKFNDLQHRRPNHGELPDATAIGEYRNTGCGDGYRVFLKVDPKGVIENATFTTTGCGFGFAALALVCEVAKGKTLDQAEKITTEDIEAGVDGFPERRKNYPQSALDALHVALQNQREGRKAAARALTREVVLAKHAKGESLAGLDGTNLDLSGADLRGARFDEGSWVGANFSRANLEGASFHKCALRGLKAPGANFRGASLRRSDLYNADLSSADLSGADLRNSFLNDADLSGATLRGAQLGFCKLTGIKMEGTRFEGAFFDAMTRFDPGVVAPFDAMIRKDDSGTYFSDAPAVHGSPKA